MSVQSQTPYNSYTANGATTVFPYGFLLLDTDDLVVTVDGVVKTLTTDYTVSGLSNPSGGNVTFLSAPANGAKVLLSRLLTIERLTDYQDNGDLFADTVNNDFDRIWQSMQQLQQNDIRALKLPFDTATDQVIPEGAAARANKGVKFDASGNLILSNFDPDSAQDDATAAAATATTQAGIATTQAGIATTQAGIATTQAGIATTKAEEVATSPVAAPTHAATSKATPVDADEIPLIDSAASWVLKKLTWASLKATLKTYFDALYFSLAIQPTMRNRVINGNCQVAQRGAVAAVNNTLTYGGCDRIGVAPISFTTCSGTIQQQQAGFGEKGYSQALTGVTTTGAGVIQFVERLEAKDVKDLNGKQITVQSKFYQNTGAALNCGFVVSKAGALDNFASPTVIATGATASVPSGTLTTITTTFTMGAADCGNGLQIVAAFNGVGAVTAKDFHITELQLEAGAVATPFEHRPYQVELALCQRYYEVLRGMTSGTALDLVSAYYNAGNYWARWGFEVEKRATPTIALASGASWSGATPSVYASLNAAQFNTTVTFYVQAGANGAIALSASSEL